MMKIEDLKVDKRFERLTPVSNEELKALENLIVGDGEIHAPIVVWKGQNIIVDGHERWNVLKKHPELPYSIKEIEFQDWREVIVWIVEHHIARKSFTLWQKLEMAMNCVEYWEAKDNAKRNQGTRSDLLSPGDKKLESMDINKVIAEKVGCSRTTVTMFKMIFNSPSEGLKQKCRAGEMSIKKASDSLKPKETDNNKPGNKKSETVIKNEEINILKACEKNQTVSDNSDIAIPDSAPIVEKITQPKVPDEVIWFAINPVEQTIQMFLKKHDSETGNNNIHINTYSFTTVSTIGATSILQVKHVGGSTEDVIRKDDCAFKSEGKEVS